MKGILLTIIFLAIPEFPSAQNLQSEPDLASGLIAGEIDYNTYLDLKDLMENKPNPCAALDRLALVPEITQEDLDTLERFCSEDNSSVARLPPDLLEKISPFVNINASPVLVRAEYRFSRDISDTSSPRVREHYFSLQSGSGPVSAVSQGRSNAYGQGYFFRNGLGIRDYGFIRSLQIGTYTRRTGLMLTFGGIARTSQDTVKPSSFSESVLAPTSIEPFGVFFSLNSTPFSPFALISANRNPGRPGREKFLRAAGIEFAKKHLQAGFILLSARTPCLQSGRFLESECAGAYGTWYQAGTTFSAEISAAQAGYAFEVKGLRKSNGVDLGIDARQYSADYFNPAGRGTADFASGFTAVSSGTDSGLFSGLRKGEWGGQVFARFKGRDFYIRPCLFSAYSDRLLTGKTGLSLKEHLSAERIGTQFAAEERVCLISNNKDTATQVLFSVCSNTTATRFLSMRLSERLNTCGASLWNLYSRMDLSVNPIEPLILCTGGFTVVPVSGNGTSQAGIILEEKFRIKENGFIRIYCTLLRTTDLGMDPRTFGIIFNLKML
jgi:hypothetical protein